MRRRPRLLLTLALSAGLLTALPAAAAGIDEMRAVFILNLIRFAEWPAGERGGPFRVCLLGDEDERLAAMLAGRSVKDSHIEVPMAPPARLAECRLVYVLHPGLLGEALVRAAAAPMLIVAELPAAQAGGAALRVAAQPDRIEFEIDPAAIRRSGVVLSGRLLRLARNFR